MSTTAWRAEFRQPTTGSQIITAVYTITERWNKDLTNAPGTDISAERISMICEAVGESEFLIGHFSPNVNRHLIVVPRENDSLFHPKSIYESCLVVHFPWPTPISHCSNTQQNEQASLVAQSMARILKTMQ